MKVDMETFDSWSDFAFQDLLIDVTAVVAATEHDRAMNGNGVECTQCGDSRETPLRWLTERTVGITKLS